MSITALSYTLDTSCPVAWPAATPAMMDYPLIQDKEETNEDFVSRAYVEALWLPESIMPLSHLVHTIRRVQPLSIRNSVKPVLLSLRAIEQKYQERLPALLVNPNAALKRVEELGEEMSLEENAMWYAWHHGRPPTRHFPDPEAVDEEKWKRVWMRDMERREVMVQVLLHCLYLAAPAPLEKSSNQQLETPIKNGKRKRGSSPDARATNGQRGRRGRQRKRKGDAKEEEEFHPEENLDMLTDRIAIWQAVEEEGEKFLDRAGDNGRDWMRVFYEDLVGPLFSSELPELVKQFEEKIIPPSAHPSSTSSSEDELPKSALVPKKRKSHPVRKPTLTEADLANLKISGTVASRSRSISVEPDGRARSRSRSVSLAAEEIKAVGGQRGGIAGNRKLFDREVEMRKSAVPSPITGTFPLSASTATPPSVASSVPVKGFKGLKQARPIPHLGVSSGKMASSSKPTSLVAGTPARTKSTTLVGDSDDDDDVTFGDDGVPESPEVQYLGRKLAEKVPETPLKGKGSKRK